jgi:hypothetical protein
MPRHWPKRCNCSGRLGTVAGTSYRQRRWKPPTAEALYSLQLPRCSHSAVAVPAPAEWTAVTDDERGGKVSYANGKISVAMNATQAHCAKFGKKAQITQMVSAPEGGQIGFECR